MEYITAEQYAELKGCTVRYVRKIAKEGKISAEQSLNDKGRMKYMIPISALSEELQIKYCKQLKADAGIKTELKKPIKQHKTVAKRSFEDFSAAERDEIALWCEILQDWQMNRAAYTHKVEFDKLYVGKAQLEHPEIKISTDILYRKYASYRDQDYEGLIDKRGAWNKGTSSIPPQVWSAFLYEWLDENKPTLSRCYELATYWTAEFNPELIERIPCENTFRRHVKSDLSKALVTYMREGDKACNDRCLPYITRMYDKLHANDVWIADNHTLDIQSINDEGSIHRLYITTFQDAKSGVIVGWNLTDNPCSQSTILALRYAIKRYGIPRMVYFDNGAEFLNHDIGGRGHRTKKNAPVVPPTILKRLGIEMRNALVRNAKAKPIERTFYTLKMQFSKAFNGYCGGTILERPESLKRRIKNGQIPRDYEIRDFMDIWIDGDYNMQSYGGSEVRYKSKSRIDVWNEDIQSVGVQMATEADLNLMLMRCSRYQKIKRNGVFVEISGEKLWYMDALETFNHLDEEVAVRYDPADLSSVRIYDKDDRYLFTWALADKLMIDYITQNKQEISDAESMIRSVKKFIKEQANGITAGLNNEQRISMIDMTIQRAYAQKEKFEIKIPTNIIPVRSSEESALKVSGGGTEDLAVSINLDKMIRNAEKRKE